jgi:type IV pilus assembly protein PilV
MPMNQALQGNAKGFTLIEVLVSLVILAIGMLGIAALLLGSLQASRTALVRTQAVNLATDAAEMASNDLKRWQLALAATLPEGEGTISVQPLTATLFQYTVTVAWTQSGESTPLNYSITVDI